MHQTDLWLITEYKISQALHQNPDDSQILLPLFCHLSTPTYAKKVYLFSALVPWQTIFIVHTFKDFLTPKLWYCKSSGTKKIALFLWNKKSRHEKNLINTRFEILHNKLKIQICLNDFLQMQVQADLSPTFHATSLSLQGVPL